MNKIPTLIPLQHLHKLLQSSKDSWIRKKAYFAKPNHKDITINQIYQTDRYYHSTDQYVTKPSVLKVSGNVTKNELNLVFATWMQSKLSLLSFRRNY